MRKSVLVLFLVLLDQITKYFAEVYLKQSINIFNGLNLTLAHNKGAAFSFLADQPGWQLYFFSGIAIFLIIVMFSWIKTSKSKLEKYSLLLILSGAAGNLIDRINLGYVVDFIEIYYKQYYFPIFNIADICITVGGFFLCLAFLKSTKC